MLKERVVLKTSILILFAAFVSTAVQADSTLWKVTSGKHTLYVQGSSHVLKQENYPVAPAIEAAYTTATALVLEVDMAEMTSPKTQQLILGKAMLPQPETLQTVLQPETYKRLGKAAADSGLPVETLHPFKPWFATMTLTLVKMQKLGFDQNLGLDQYFYNKAVSDGKKVIGLETIDFQIALFDSLANENPDDFVNRSLADLELLDTEITELIKAWETGDMETLDRLMSKSFAEYPGLYAKFITARNKAWVKQLSKMIKDDNTYMVVVGAGHLPGQEGVINLLRKQGFSTEQL
ncbi:TraB/GumN family protein [Pontiellaceae bacterium B12227]|nr:TraB/GumN family protein [Pontiellaceae bacterium B12227]